MTSSANFGGSPTWAGLMRSLTGRRRGIARSKRGLSGKRNLPRDSIGNRTSHSRQNRWEASLWPHLPAHAAHLGSAWGRHEARMWSTVALWSLGSNQSTIWHHLEPSTTCRPPTFAVRLNPEDLASTPIPWKRAWLRHFIGNLLTGSALSDTRGESQTRRSPCDMGRPGCASFSPGSFSIHPIIQARTAGRQRYWHRQCGKLVMNHGPGIRAVRGTRAASNAGFRGFGLCEN